MVKIFISTAPFGEHDDRPLWMLHEAGAEITVNPLGHRLSEADLIDHIGDADALIAGTEPITQAVMAAAPRLRLIARVGIGVDNVDLLAARRRGIKVCYTPDAPSPAVAELTIGQILALLRGTHIADSSMRSGGWHRHLGRRIGESTVGVIGYGRIGRRVVDLLTAFDGCHVLVNDIDCPTDLPKGANFSDKATIFREADVVTVHVPLTRANIGMIGQTELEAMGSNCYIINTARGGIVDEAALANALRNGMLAGAAIDVFQNEPYNGPLCEMVNCLLTCHMGSMSIDCRMRMEREAADEVMRLLQGEPQRSPVPPAEYDLQAEFAEQETEIEPIAGWR